MSFNEEREDEDIMAQASSSSDESIHNVSPRIRDATVTSDPWYEKSFFHKAQKCQDHGFDS